MLLDNPEWFDEFLTGLLDVIGYIALGIGAIVALYAFFLFYVMATASNEEKRRTAKKRVFNAVASMLIIVALFSLIQVLEIQYAGVNTGDQGKTPPPTIAKYVGLPTMVIDNASDSGFKFKSGMLLEDTQLYLSASQQLGIIEYYEQTYKKKYVSSFTLSPSQITMEDGSKAKKVTGFTVSASDTFAGRFFKNDINGMSLNVTYNMYYAEKIGLKRPYITGIPNYDENGEFSYFVVWVTIEFDYLPAKFLTSDGREGGEEDIPENYESMSIFTTMRLNPRSGVYYQYVDLQGNKRKVEN